MVGRGEGITVDGLIVDIDVRGWCNKAEFAYACDIATEGVEQITRRLVGEGQAKHLLRAHVTATDQPGHPGRHRGGLARTSTRHDDSGFHRSTDCHPLLVADLEAKDLEQVRTREIAHVITGNPSDCAGQAVRYKQRSQC